MISRNDPAHLSIAFGIPAGCAAVLPLLSVLFDVDLVTFAIAAVLGFPLGLIACVSGAIGLWHGRALGGEGSRRSTIGLLLGAASIALPVVWFFLLVHLPNWT